VTDLWTDFVATGADGRTCRGDKVSRSAAKLAGERFDGDARHAGRQAAPARVGRGDGSGAPIGNEDRHAIGRLDRDGDGGIV